MSIWAHACGIIRADAIRVDDDFVELDFDKLVGKEFHWYPHDYWDLNDEEKEIRRQEISNEYANYAENPDSYLPMGSEGTLQKSVWINPDNSCMASYTISIFGDLRDYSDPQKIIEWFKQICNKFYVRQAVITVEGLGGITSWTYGEEDSSD